MYDLKAVQMNMQHSLIQKQWWVKAKLITVWQLCSSRFFALVARTSTIRQSLKTVDSGVVLQAIEANKELSDELGISQSTVICHFEEFGKSIHSCWIVPHVTKMPQNLWQHFDLPFLLMWRPPPPHSMILTSTVEHKWHRKSKMTSSYTLLHIAGLQSLVGVCFCVAILLSCGLILEEKTKEDNSKYLCRQWKIPGERLAYAPSIEFLVPRYICSSFQCSIF